MHSEAGRNAGKAFGLVDTEAYIVISYCSAFWQEDSAFAKQLARVLSFA